ncbi:MAG TPA: hypothetical protein VFW87_07570 [Pirellulales bacterium]|nr:hypothetical protein [Pirellulales bacterium]
MRIKVAGVDDPFARAATGVLERNPDSIPAWLHNCTFGQAHVEAVYIYPLPLGVGS